MTRHDAFLKLTEYNVQIKNVSLPAGSEGLSVSIVLDFAFQITDAELEKAKEIWVKNHAGDWGAPGFFSIGYLNIASIEFVEYTFSKCLDRGHIERPAWMNVADDYEKPEYHFQ